MIFLVVAVVAFIVTTYSVAIRLLVLPHDVREPPLIPQSIPIFGHLIGMLRYGSKYYSTISQSFNLPIYTLQLPKSKVYVVNSPDLVSLVDRHAKTISFAPYVVQFAKRILSPSTEAIGKLGDDLLEESGLPNLRQETLKEMHRSLATGEGLEGTTQEAVASLNRIFDSRDGSISGNTIHLFAWVREIVTTASTDAMYGIEYNPIRDSEVREAFWAIDDDFALLGLDFFPATVAPKGTRGRNIFIEALNRYYVAERHKTASAVVQGRYEVNQKFGISTDDIAHFDIALCYGLLVNTVPTVSWVLYYVFSDPRLLATFRNAISEAAGIEFAENDMSCYKRVNVAKVAARFPPLSSLVRETLRIQSTNAASRVLLKDTMLDDQYLLRKGSFLFIPSAVIHESEAVWGASAKTFDPRRFLKQAGVKGMHKIPASSYRAFGSGASVCPGRFLATNEILATVIMMVLKYDLSPTAGKWAIPQSEPHITKSVLTPVGDIEVLMMEREAVKGMTLNFYWDSQDV